MLRILAFTLLSLAFVACSDDGPTGGGKSLQNVRAPFFNMDLVETIAPQELPQIFLRKL